MSKTADVDQFQLYRVVTVHGWCSELWNTIQRDVIVE